MFASWLRMVAVHGRTLVGRLVQWSSNLALVPTVQMMIREERMESWLPPASALESERAQMGGTARMWSWTGLGLAYSGEVSAEAGVVVQVHD